MPSMTIRPVPAISPVCSKANAFVMPSYFPVCTVLSRFSRVRFFAGSPDRAFSSIPVTSYASAAYRGGASLKRAR